MAFSSSKSTKTRFRPALHPDPAGGGGEGGGYELTTLPHPLVASLV